jgi:putative PIN family toxin of toxin-antitoxin system
VKIIIDCNVFISAGISNGVCREVFFEALGHHQIFVSPGILHEYERVIRRPRFQKSFKELQRMFQRINDLALSIEPIPCPFSLPDPTDEVYLATAMTVKADVLITGNKKHFLLPKYRDVLILSPREFLDSIKNI